MYGNFVFCFFLVDALSVYDISFVSLPTTGQATNLGFGISLITYAADDFP